MSVASRTVMSGTCGNGIGAAYFWFAPTGTDTVTSDMATVEAA